MRIGVREGLTDDILMTEGFAGEACSTLQSRDTRNRHCLTRRHGLLPL